MKRTPSTVVKKRAASAGKMKPAAAALPPPRPEAPAPAQGSHKMGMTVAALRHDFERHLRYTLVRDRYTATDRDRYYALALAVRDRLIERWIATQQTHHDRDVKRVYYLSLEFLIGRMMGTNVINLEMEDICRSAMKDFGLDWNSLRDYEVDAGLGNGGLGRLAACYLESISTLKLPAVGYGLRYDFGIFNQRIVNGYQVEEPDHWLKHGYPWEIPHPEYSFEVHFGGKVESHEGPNGLTHRWVDTRPVTGLPYDLPMVGYRGVVNTLRLWSARAAEEFDFDDFNRGSYVAAVENKVLAENLTKVLYPNDNSIEGRELRLKQQYFFVSCSLQDIFRRFRTDHSDWNELPDKAFIQLNDTHPTLVIPEMMRLLIDREGLGWEDAWRITTACTGYTNHTLLPEALEKWPVEMFERLLPRHLQIIYEINARHLRDVATRYPFDPERLRRMSLIEDGSHKQVRMAYLAVVGSSAVNGVAELHTRLLRDTVLRDFAEMWPEKFSNKTNGITPRRWLLKANPGLADLISRSIGKDWITNLDQFRRLEPLAKDAAFRRDFEAVKRQNKTALSNYIRDRVGVSVSPDSLFDVQVKRIHEYKRQHLLALYVIMLYLRLKDNPALDIVPRTFIFSGKAAPGYHMAKLIIKLVHQVAEVVNSDRQVADRLKVVFLPNYRVSMSERIIPAADVSEQISLAGTEASGTGNMKLQMNGAITLGTLDGANIEIREEVGEENIVIFGMTSDEVRQRRPTYNPFDILQADAEIQRALQFLQRDFFSMIEPGIFQPLVHSLMEGGDRFMLLADLRSYAEAQDRVDAMYRDRKGWNEKSILNVARSAKFSSDRAVREYAEEIWKIQPCEVPMD